MRLVLVAQHKEFAEKIRRVIGQEHHLGTFLTPDLLLQSQAALDSDCMICESEFFSRLKPEFKNPIFIASSADRSNEWVPLLKEGADGVLFEELSGEAVVTQIFAHLKRWKDRTATRRYLSQFGLLIDLERYRVELGGSVLDLTLTELKVLKELACDDDRVIPRLAIQQQVFGQLGPGNRSLDVHVCSLRKKLRPHGLDVESVRGVGYRLLSYASGTKKSASANEAP